MLINSFKDDYICWRINTLSKCLTSGLNNNNTGLLYSAFSIISSKRFTQYYPSKDS